MLFRTIRPCKEGITLPLDKQGSTEADRGLKTCPKDGAKTEAGISDSKCPVLWARCPTGLGTRGCIYCFTVYTVPWHTQPYFFITDTSNIDLIISIMKTKLSLRRAKITFPRPPIWAVTQNQVFWFHVRVFLVNLEVSIYLLCSHPNQFCPSSRLYDWKASLLSDGSRERRKTRILRMQLTADSCKKNLKSSGKSYSLLDISIKMIRMQVTVHQGSISPSIRCWGRTRPMVSSRCLHEEVSWRARGGTCLVVCPAP